MSLIMDALRKAQQLRLQEPQEIDLPLPPEPEEKRKGSGGKRWLYIGGALLVIAVFFVTSSLFRKSRPPALHSVSLETEIQAPRQEKIVRPVRDVLGPAQEATKESEPEAEVSSPPSTNLSLSLTIPAENKTPSPVKPAENEKIVKAAPGAASPPPVAASPPPVANPAPSVKPPPLRVPVPLKPKIPPKAPPAPPFKTSPAKTSLAPAKENPPKPAADSPSHPITVKQETEKGRLLNLEAIKQFNLGVQLHHQREFSKAIEAYNGVLEKDPENFETYNNIGLIHQEMGDLEKASQAYRKSIEINPRYEKGHNNLGTLLHLQGRDAEAIEAFQKALAVNSSNIESHLNLGVALTKQGLFEQAVESYRKALEINPFHRETHYNIALLYERMEKNDLAILHYGRFIQLSSSNTGLVLKVRKHLEDLVESEKTKGD